MFSLATSILRPYFPKDRPVVLLIERRVDVLEGVRFGSEADIPAPFRHPVTVIHCQ